MPMLRRQRVMAAKIETTIGTAETLAAADAAFNIYGPAIQCTTPMEQREGQGGFGYLPSSPGGHTGTATFRTNLEWDGTATEPSWADTFLPACGWVKTGQVYYPTTEAPGANVKTLTIGLFQNDGAAGCVFKSIAGAMGSFVVNLPTGRLGWIDWTFMGVWQEPTAQAMIVPTYPTVKGLRFAGGLAEWNNVNLCVEAATINSGNTVIMRECPTTEAGYISALVTNRLPTISMNPEAHDLATQNRWASWLAQDELALELDVGGPTTSQIEFNAPKAQIINNQEAERNGLVADQLELQCNKNGEDDDEELTITFTAAV